jgi:hypothetical protein
MHLAYVLERVRIEGGRPRANDLVKSDIVCLSIAKRPPVIIIQSQHPTPARPKKMFAGVLLTLALALPLSQAGAPPTPESAWNDAGYIDVHDDQHHMFYWVFESRDQPSTDPVVKNEKSFYFSSLC